jgi:hypothetical protein
MHNASVMMRGPVDALALKKLSPGEERNFKGTFRLLQGVQPSYQGKYAKHEWRLRARLDVLGVDPGTGWLAFRVGAPS